MMSSALFHQYLQWKENKKHLFLKNSSSPGANTVLSMPRIIKAMLLGKSEGCPCFFLGEKKKTTTGHSSQASKEVKM